MELPTTDGFENWQDFSNALLDALNFYGNEVERQYLSRHGGWQGEMLDYMSLYANPTASLHAAPKQYVDAESHGYIYGLTLSTGTDSGHDIDITVGQCLSEDSTYNLMQVKNAISKQLDYSWAVGGTPTSPVGGLFIGSIAANTWYHIFIIRKDSDGTIDAGFDTSVTATNRPSGYTAYRRIGSVYTDGSANILEFKQVGDYFYWSDVIRDVSNNQFGSTQGNVAISVPPGVEVIAICKLRLEDNSYTALSKMVFGHPDQTLVTPLSFGGEAWLITAAATTEERSKVIANIPTDTNQQIRYLESRTDTDVTWSLGTIGWIDLRGKEG